MRQSAQVCGGPACILFIILNEDESDDDKRAKELEVEGVKSAEANDFDAALNYFSQAVSIAPNRASCYNNRAQALRLRGDVDGLKNFYRTRLHGENHPKTIENAKEKQQQQA
eukprot:XP_011661225.1 PREDICTED: tetratricopeptide repeat protein 36 homolog [Strongylocentrotus purpuratus]